MLREKVNRDGWCLWNSSLIEPHEETNLSHLAVPASEMAEGLGDVRAANAVMTGALIRILEDHRFPVTQHDLLAGLRETLPDRKQQTLNWRAMLQGRKFAEKALHHG